MDTINRVVPQLIARGKYIRPNLGIGVDRDINRLVTEELGIEGVLVQSVEPSSAAEIAGLKGTRIARDGTLIVGDIILRINNRPVDSVNSLLSRFDEFIVGDTIKLDIWRAGREISMDVVLKPGSWANCVDVQNCSNRHRFVSQWIKP